MENEKTTIRDLALKIGRQENAFYSLLIVLVVTIAYRLTLLPGLGYSGDTAKYQYIGKILGIPHAPGYPLYVLLNHLFVRIPVGSIAFRANLMSAFFAVLTLLVLYRLNRTLFGSGFISFLSALFFGFNLVFWSQSVVAEVYTLNTFFMALSLLLLIRWSQTRKTSFFYFFCLVYALSFGNHLSMITLFPAALFFIVIVDAKILFKAKSWAVGLACFLIGLGQYGFLFIRTRQQAPYLENKVFDVRSFLNVITAKQFRGQMFSFSFHDVLTERIPKYARAFLSNWTIALVLVGTIGLIVLWRRDRKIAALLLLAVLGQSLFLVNYRILDIEAYFIPPYLLFSIFIGSGLFFLREKAKPWRVPAALFHFVSLAALAGMLAVNGPKADLSRQTEDDLRLTVLFENFESVAVIATDAYQDAQFVRYKMFVEFPEKVIIPVSMHYKNTVAREIEDKITDEIRNNTRLRKTLLPSGIEDVSAASAVEIFWKTPDIRRKMLDHIYLLSPDTQAKFESLGIRTRPIRVISRKTGRTFVFFNVRLEE